MNFAEKLFKGLQDIGQFFLDAIESLFEFLAIPLGYILAFFEGVFYFIGQLFTVVIEIIMIFVALFQFLFAIIAGLFRTITMWIGFTPSDTYSMPSTSQQGLNVFIEQIDILGLYDIVPYIVIAFIWLMFAYKVVGMVGNRKDGVA